MTADQPTSRTIAAVTRITSVRVTRLALLDLCNEAKRFADAKSTMPILATALLQVEGDKLRVAATDLLRTVDAKVAASTSTSATGILIDFAAAIEESVRLKLCADQTISLPPPAVGIDAKKLHEVVKALPGDIIEVLFIEKMTLTEIDTFRANKTRVCSVCRKRSTLASAVDGTCSDKPSHAAKLPCGGKLLDTSRDVAHSVEVSLLSGKSRFNLRSLAGRDFPKLPAIDARLWHHLDAAVLREVLDKVAPTIFQDSTRSDLNGALLEISSGLLRGVSSDGHRLTKVDRAITTTMSTAHCPNKGFVLPLPGVAELLKFLPTLISKPKKGVLASADVEVALSGDSHFHWRRPGGDVVYTQKLESAQFPPYDQIIPRNCERWVRFDRTNLIGALKRVLIVASDKTAGVKLSWQGAVAGNDDAAAVLTLSAENTDDEAATEDLDAMSAGALSYSAVAWSHRVRELQRCLRDSWGQSDYAKMAADQTQPFLHGLNGKYFVAALEELAATEIWIGMNDELSPIVVKASKADADVVVIMPMRP